MALKVCGKSINSWKYAELKCFERMCVFGVIEREREVASGSQFGVGVVFEGVSIEAVHQKVIIKRFKEIVKIRALLKLYEEK